MKTLFGKTACAIIIILLALQGNGIAQNLKLGGNKIKGNKSNKVGTLSSSDENKKDLFIITDDTVRACFRKNGFTEFEKFVLVKDSMQIRGGLIWWLGLVSRSA